MFDYSYDNFIKAWDFRKLSRPVFSSTDTGSGVWRIASHPTNSKKIACANMHSGVSLYAIDQTENLLNISELERFSDVHNSLVYGIDIIPYTPHSDLVASCSFYDSQICIREVFY